MRLAMSIRRYRYASGERAVLGRVAVDPSAPSMKLRDDEPLHLRCGLEQAGERMQRIVEQGLIGLRELVARQVPVHV